ncbi:MAG: AMP-binding protein [Prevotellaceae bacterium]|nr:AMP-binding protein [Prevotellaceae bacterium]
MAYTLDTSKVESLSKIIERSIVKYWDTPALSDYQGRTLQFKDVARKIEKLHILFEEAGVKAGDKIAICGRNSTNWAVTFFASITYGTVTVPLLADFTPEQIHNTVNHSDAKLLFVGDYVATIIDGKQMPCLEGIINLPDFSIIEAKSEPLVYAREHLNELFGRKYPKFFRKENVCYFEDKDPNAMCLINYTSGTTGFSKGVMIPYRAMWSNLDFAMKTMNKCLHPGENYISMLPLGHMFGIAFELVFPFVAGRHIHFLNRTPSPQVLLKAYAEIRPTLVISVPLVIEKIIRKKVFPKIHTLKMQALLRTPIVGKKVKEKIREQVMNAFGGNFFELIVGGAAFNKEVENFLRDERIPYCVGYGATECAPLITYAHWMDVVPGSCGRPCANIEIEIDSTDPRNIPGEILVRGLNVMLGYYKAEEQTRQALDEDGWYHTGDLGIMDEDGFLFIKGRSKNMLLGSNGQNIYPEEIEDRLNNMDLVVESVVVQRQSKLVGLVFPDYDEARKQGLNQKAIEEVMEQNRVKLNESLPVYSKIFKIELTETEFAKTAKRSIKRFLYK